MKSGEYLQLLVRLMPETILVLGALVVLFADQYFSSFWSKRKRSGFSAATAVITLLTSIFWLSAQGPFEPWLNGLLVGDSLVLMAKQFILLLAVFAVISGPADKFTAHLGEYYALILLSTVGMVTMAGTEDLLMAFIALEMASLSLYVLTAFNKQNAGSAEAALKYFLFGSVSAAFTLFGITLLFGMAGSTRFSTLSTLAGGSGVDPLFVLGAVMTVLGLGFKVAAAPMHLWAPDVYGGAPIPSAAFIAGGSKLASFFLFGKLFIAGLAPAMIAVTVPNDVPGWIPALAFLAGASIVVGNLVAIAQKNLRRLLAYSAVAHSGYALLAILAGDARGLSSLLYYAFTYGLSVLGAFAVAGVLEARQGSLQMDDLRGLSRRSPGLAFCLAIFILSLAGIPPLAGFFGKFYVFVAALKSDVAGPLGLVWLVVLAVAGSALSLYYYLQVLKNAYVLEPDETTEVPRVTRGEQSVIWILALTVIILGVFPDLLVGPLESAAAVTSNPAALSAK